MLYAPLADYTFRQYEQRRCEAAPASWSLHLDYGARVYGYDTTSYLSGNPDAPPLRRSLAERVDSMSPPIAIDFGLWSSQGGAMVIRTANRGPCALVQATWPNQPIYNAAILSLIAGALVVAGVAAALALMVVAPLLRRIARLRASAERLGDAAGYVPAERNASDELGQLSVALDRAHARIREDAARLERRQLDLQRHLADVAHDLKTPISSLHLTLEQAADASGGHAVGDLVTQALDDVVYLAGLTSNLRLASEIREGWDPAATEATVDLTETVEHVVGRTRFFAKRKGIGLDAAVPDGPTLARCDPIAAAQALSNVVENAVTHNDRGGHVAVVLHVSDGAFALTVSDDGPGVPPAVLPRLGERTFRSDDARQRDPRGSGLGLAITSEVCARCGWRLSFDPERPRGLRVTVSGLLARA
jgi:signal transduction histidine kinase